MHDTHSTTTLKNAASPFTGLNIKRFALISLFVILISYVVYAKNGTSTAYTQLMYIPIILSAFYWRVPGGIVTALAAGILLGPFMPLDVALGIMQTTDNWVLRLSIFIFVGGFTGYFFMRVDWLNKKSREKDFINPFTGIYSTNKLILDLKDRMASGEDLSIISVKLTNIDSIEKYVDHDLVNKIIANIIEAFRHNCNRDAIYSFGSDELVLVACADCVEYFEKVEQVVKTYASSVTIDQYTFRVAMKVGLYQYTGGDETPEEVYNKARIAYEQGELQESGIYYYNEQMDQLQRDRHMITGALLGAIRNKELYMMYQPKINLSDSSIAGVEALIRWNRGNHPSIGPSEFIPIAENIGFIKEITVFVLDSITDQLIQWQAKGIDVKCSLNVTSKEILDDDLSDQAQSIIESKNIDRRNMEIEITERILSYDNQQLFDKIQLLRQKGYVVSIDDFGTGYNSLMSVGEIPFDLLKIDKYFIDRIERHDIKELVRHIIDYCHSLGKVVVAEGVETQAQVEILRELGCDQVQGYYFAKPMLPHELEAFYRSQETTEALRIHTNSILVNR